MENLESLFDKLKNSENSEAINDFLIELGTDPREEFLSYVKYFINNCTQSCLDNININLIYVLGQIGKYMKIDDEFIDYLYQEYFKSDRWIRNEILKSLNSIAINRQLPNKILQIIEIGLIDDYIPIRLNSLSTMLHFDSLSASVFNNLIGTLSTSNSKLLDLSERVFKKFVINNQQLFRILNHENNYIRMDKHSIRRLLLINFKSALELEHFRELILNSNWSTAYKEIFLKEIFTFEQILLKNL